MSDSHQPEEATREGGSAVTLEDHDEHADDVERTDTEHDSTDGEHSEHDEHDDDHETVASDESADDEHDDEDEDDDDEDDDEAGSSRTGLYVASGVAALAVIGVLVLLAAFVWPNFAGPGKPDDVAGQAVSAIAAKDSGRLDQVGCKRRDGKPTTQLPPDALQFVQSATPTGPPLQTLDTEARQPFTLTLNVEGQPRTVPAEIVLSVNDGSWCMNGIAGTQQQ